MLPLVIVDGNVLIPSLPYTVAGAPLAALTSSIVAPEIAVPVRDSNTTLTGSSVATAFDNRRHHPGRCSRPAELN